MNLEQLQEALAKGEITQAEFDAKKAELEAGKGGEGGSGGNDQTIDIEALLANDQFKQYIESVKQSASDKVRTEKTIELKAIKDELTSLKNEKLTDEQRFEIEKKDYEKNKSEFEKQKLDFEFLKTLSEKKLSSDLVNVIPGDTLEKRIENLKVLEQVIEGTVKEKVGEKFGSQNHNFEEGKGSNTDVSKMSIDEQIKYYEDNPDKLV